MLSTGLSGSATSASSAQTACSRAAAPSGLITADIALASPPHARIGALQVLHFREHVTQVLGVHAAPAMPGVRLRRRALQGRGSQILIDARRPARRELHERRGDSGGLHAFIDLIGGEQFGGGTPQGIEARPNPLVTLPGAVAGTDEAAAAGAVGVTGFLEGLCGGGGEERGRGPRQPRGGA